VGIVDNLMTHPASITRRSRTGTPDTHGVPLAETTAPVAVLCYLEQTGSSEVTAGREATIGDYRAYFPAGTELDGTDIVTIDGTDYEVVGPPAAPRNPLTNAVDHIMCSLRVTTG
jgi:hypothetical protein